MRSATRAVPRAPLLVLVHLPNAGQGGRGGRVRQGHVHLGFVDHGGGGVTGAGLQNAEPEQVVHPGHDLAACGQHLDGALGSQT